MGSHSNCGVKIRVFILDAFTDKPFTGNSCAVCLIPEDVEIEDEKLRKIAMELNRSETAFVKHLPESSSFKHGEVFGLRWFNSKNKEVRMCGNGTLSSAAVIFHALGNKRKCVEFRTILGELFVKREDDYIHIDFPIGYTVDANREEIHELLQAQNLLVLACDLHYHDQVLLSHLFSFLATNKFIMSLGDTCGVRDVVFCERLRYVLIRLHDGWTMSEFEKWKPDTAAMLAPTQHLSLNSVIVTTRGSPELGYTSSTNKPYDFVSRCFTPWMPVHEHQATGSTHTVLAHYWAQHLHSSDFFARQCSARGGEFVLRLRGDRVHILGKVTFVMEGEITL